MNLSIFWRVYFLDLTNIMMLLHRREFDAVAKVCCYMTPRLISSKVTEQQIHQLDDKLPLVDINDRVLGPSTKRHCHEGRDDNNGKGILHRAFSVFLFNSKNQLLLQQRSQSKVYFSQYIFFYFVKAIYLRENFLILTLLIVDALRAQCAPSPSCL